MKKLCVLIAAAILLAMAMPLSAMADPNMSGNVINVTAADAQDLLDGKFGNITGKTINFTENVNTVLDLARPTKYEGSGTTYQKWNSGTYGDMTDDPEGMTSASKYYRTLKNVTFTADEGVKVAGFSFASGHVYAAGGYDYVRDQATGNGQTYYRYSSLDNIKFKGLTITGNIDFMLYGENTSIGGIEIDDCTFNGSKKISGKAAIYMLADNMYFKNVTVKNCTITDYFQGLYISGIDGLTVANNTIKNTEHNAIALQSSTDNQIKGTVSVKENYISGAKDRAIRINEATSAANIAINNNIMVNSGDGDGELIKAGAINSAKVNLENNYWDGKNVSKAVAGTLTEPKNTGLVSGTFSEEVLEKYCADGYTGVQNADGSFTVMDISKLPKNSSDAVASLPQTGDNSCMLLWAVLLAVSGACLTGLRKRANG